jgi:hypothetical protein
MAWMKRLMGTVVAVIALAAVFSTPGLAAALENDPPAFQGSRRPFTLLSPADPAPAAPIYTLRGGVTTLKRFSGKVVVVEPVGDVVPSLPARAADPRQLARQNGR